MMKTLYGDFSNNTCLVLATVQCHNVETSGPILIIFSIILMRNQCYVLSSKNLKIIESIHVTHFGRLGHNLIVKLGCSASSFFGFLSLVSIFPEQWCDAALAVPLQRRGAESPGWPRDPPQGCPRWWSRPPPTETKGKRRALLHYLYTNNDRTQFYL